MLEYMAQSIYILYSLGSNPWPLRNAIDPQPQDSCSKVARYAVWLQISKCAHEMFIYYYSVHLLESWRCGLTVAKLLNIHKVLHKISEN